MTNRRHAHDLGLCHDLNTLAALNRREVLRLFAGAGLVPLIGCSGTRDTLAGSVAGHAGTGGSGPSSDGSTATGGSGPSGDGSASCVTMPEETAGPYPGDGTNGPNALTASGIVRSDIRPSFGTLSGTAAGVLLTVKLVVVGASSGCAPLSKRAVYLWHCDQDGNYSLYTLASQNYLRGVQETDASGVATFTTVFPGCYPGRWPHIHFEVFSSVATATAAGAKLKTSQLALPGGSCSAVYATTGYGTSATYLSQITIATDGVFSDGAEYQVPAVTGNTTDGYVATLQVAV